MKDSNRKLNIAMVCDPVGSNKSGVVVSTMRFSKLLKDRGHNVVFIGAKSKEYKGDTVHDGVKAYRFRNIPIPKSGGWNLAFPSTKELKKVFKDEKIDVVHILLPMSGSFMAVKAARELGVKMVAHSHAQPENVFLETPKILQPVFSNLFNKYLVWLYGKSESLIYPSQMAQGLLESKGSKGQPSTVISNGINLEHFKPMEVGDFYDRYNIPKDAIKLLYVGRLFPEKSIHTLIEALPHMKDKNANVHLMIVGGGHLRDKLEGLVKKLKIEKYVTFLGLVSEEDKILAYNASDIFILPSLAELEGMVVLEAMACGKPIIISDSEMSASKFFVDGNGFLFKTGDSVDLAFQTLKLLKDESLRHKMGQVSLENVKKYDIQRSVELLEEVYNKALK